MFIDFSCGKNEFVPLLSCKTVAYDISPCEGGIIQDWLTVSNVPENAIIGLNPPFGYQGRVAKEFIEHGLKFSPKYLFLILPNMRWKPPGYEIIYEEDLPDDSYYEPISNKTFKEISTTFFIFKRSPPNYVITKPKSNRTNIIPGIHITRKWPPKVETYVILRRVGRNTTKQFYCVFGSLPANCLYIECGKIYEGNILLEFFI